MNLDCFRELLLRKTDDPNLSTLISFIREENLADIVMESLEKAHATKGRAANSAITTWAGNATDTDIDMFHDALGHHISRYKAEKQAGNKDVANKHLEKVMHLADLGSKASKHSQGKLEFDAVPPHAWEMNLTGTERNPKTGKFKNDQQGFKRRLSNSGLFKDYSYLEGEPHQEYKTKSRLRNHSGGYPFEEMKVNDKYVHVDHDAKPTGKFEPHEFDNHPLFETHKDTQGSSKPMWEIKEHHKNEGHHATYADAMKDWEDSKHMDNWLDRHDALEQQDPKGYAARGSTKSKPVLDNVNIGAPAQQTSNAPDVKVKPKTSGKSTMSAEDMANLPPELKNM